MFRSYVPVSKALLIMHSDSSSWFALLVALNRVRVQQLPLSAQEE